MAPRRAEGGGAHREALCPPWAGGDHPSPGMALLDWLVPHLRHPRRDPVPFCDAHQRDVVKLVAGPRGIYQCDAAPCLAVGVVDSTTAPDDHVLVARWDLLRTLQAIPARPPRGTRRLVRAAIALSEGDAALLRELAAAAMNVPDHHGALEALGAIPRRPRQWRPLPRGRLLRLRGRCLRRPRGPSTVVILAALDPVEREMARLMRPLTASARGGYF